MSYSIQGIHHEALRPRRVGVCGGGRIDPAVARFCEIVGWQLAGEKGLIIATGGSRHYIGHPEDPATEWAVVKGALARIHADGGNIDQRIETLLPMDGSGDTVHFRAGKIHNLLNRSWQARRFSLVKSSDALVAIQGGGGTQLQIDLAMALGSKCLPLPFTGGICRQRWNENRESICEAFRIDNATAHELETFELERASDEQLGTMAAQVIRLVSSNLMLKCFIIMPFSSEFDDLYRDAIQPAIVDSGFAPVRADQLDLVGNAIEALRSAMVSCDCALAVLTGHNPNVMYELGFAHSLGKPVILLQRLGDEKHDGLRDLPFDLRTEFVMGYRDEAESLRGQISEVLRQLVGPANGDAR
jgi:predicted Rossmann-fold nucleotide-binding protein